MMALRGMAVGGNALLEHEVNEAGELDGREEGGAAEDEKRDAIVRLHQVRGSGREGGLWMSNTQTGTKPGKRSQ